MLSRGPSSRPSRCVRVRTMPWVSTRDRRAMAPLRVCRSGRVGEKQLLDLGKLVKQRPSLALRLAPCALRLRQYPATARRSRPNSVAAT